MKDFDFTGGYAPPPPYRSKCEVVAQWVAYYARTHAGQRPTSGWIAMKSGVSLSAVKRCVRKMGETLPTQTVSGA